MRDRVVACWRCSTYGDVYDNDGDAADCCPPEEAYQCIVCGTVCNRTADAEGCCSPQSLYRKHQSRLEEAGQLRIPE